MSSGSALRRNARLPAIALGVLGILMVVGLSQTALWKEIEGRVQSVMLARAARPFSPDVVFVDVDDETFSALRFPPPRALLARVFEAISAAGPRAIGVDMVFGATGADGAVGDAALASVLRQSGRFVLPVLCTPSPLDPESVGNALDGDTVPSGPAPALRCPGLRPPYPPLGDATPLAQTQLVHPHSTSNRGLFLFVDAGPVRLPTLALRMMQLGEPLSASELEQRPDGVLLRGRRVPLTDSGEVLVNARKRDSVDTISFLDLFRELPSSGPARLSPSTAAALQGKYVLIGASARSMNDVGYSVDGEAIPMVLMHASLLSDLLQGNTLEEVDGGSLLLAVVCGLFVLFAAGWTRPVIGTAALVAMELGILGGGFLLVRHGWLIAPVVAMSSSAFAFVLTLAGRLISEDRERRILRQAFGSYVDPTHLERILAEPGRYLALGGARKELSILFCDIKGYTALSNERDPEQVIGFLRTYLQRMTQIVRDHGGRVDKIMGDGIMAVFGDPVPNADHAARAVSSALGMQAASRTLRAEWTGPDEPAVSIRIGVATGPAFVGNIGALDAKVEYTALGATVNLASRLEGKAPAGGTLISEATRQACGDQFHYDAVTGLQLKGFTEPQTAYQVMENAGAKAASGE